MTKLTSAGKWLNASKPEPWLSVGVVRRGDTCCTGDIVYRTLVSYSWVAWRQYYVMCLCFLILRIVIMVYLL